VRSSRDSKAASDHPLRGLTSVSYVTTAGRVLRPLAEHGMWRRGLGRDRDEVLMEGGARSCWVGTCASPPQRGLVSPDCRDSWSAGVGLWNRTIVRITCEAARQGRGSPPVLGSGETLGVVPLRLEASDDEGVCGRIVSLIPRTAAAAQAMLALCIPTVRRLDHGHLARRASQPRRSTSRSRDREARARPGRADGSPTGRSSRWTRQAGDRTTAAGDDHRRPIHPNHGGELRLRRRDHGVDR
jgi:hypothetical protein